jgi:molecular chaperone GrpE
LSGSEALPAPEGAEKETVADKREEELIRALEEERRRADDYLNRLKYLQADFENFQKRAKKEINALSEAGVRKVMTELLTILDELDCALEAGRKMGENKAIIEGVEIVRKKLFEIMRKEGVERIQSVGQRFDPNRHEAVVQVHVEDAHVGMVVEEIRPGYAFRGQVIRPSLVKVAV